eukprot:5875268-Heterocapsa_arctica.AAC.1
MSQSRAGAGSPQRKSFLVTQCDSPSVSVACPARRVCAAWRSAALLAARAVVWEPALAGLPAGLPWELQTKMATDVAHNIYREICTQAAIKRRAPIPTQTLRS